jgi:hypothetical protein
MKTILYDAPGFCHTWYESSNGCIYAKWENMLTSKHMRPNCEEQLQAAIKFKAKAVIIDTSQSKGTPLVDDQKWFGEYLFPNMQKAGIKAIITVLPKDALAKLGAKSWNKTGSMFEIDFIEVGSVAEAENQAKKY